MSLFRRFSSSVAPSLVSCTLDGFVATVRLTNPAKRNALSKPVLQDLLRIFTDLGSRAVSAKTANLGQAGHEEVRVVVLASTGTVFSAGHDFKDFQNRDSAAEVLALCTQVHLALESLPQPTIAAVQGLAAGGGLQLASTCDLVYASSRASFSTPGSPAGGFCHTPAVGLAQRVHPKQAMLVLLTGEAISAEEAFRIGLVSKVIEGDALEDEVRKVAGRIAGHKSSYSALNIQSGKKTFYQQIAQPDSAGKYAVAERAMVDTMMSSDKQCFIKSFLDKKPKL